MERGTKPHRGASFGEQLRHYRTAAGLTQEELAERAELSVRGLRYLEGDMRLPYRETVERLAGALSLSPEDRGAFTAAARPRSSPLQAGSGVLRSSLRVPAGPLVGREREVATVTELLRRDDVRVLTLTGTGGVGKTRVAVEAATQLRSDFPEGVTWVPLAALTDSALVPSSIAQALGLTEIGALPLLDTLTHILRHRQSLLLLDNFEQVAPAAPFISDLVSACPDLKALITSRAALRLTGEYEFPVSPLTPPEATRPASVYALATNAAVDLFLRRAQAVRPDFVLTEANAPAVAAICRQLEGLPLALELAAARIRVLSPQAMLNRLEHRLSFLTGGAADRPAHQRAMRETIAWSYDLLEPAEQRLFRRLAVFVGGCSYSAIDAMCNGAGEVQMNVLDGIEALQRNSLLRLEETEEEDPRFVMLETIREYGLEQLVANGEEKALRAWHASYYLNYVERGAGRLLSPEQGQWLDQLEQEHDNLRASLRWCIEQRNAEMGLRLSSALWMFWYVRGYVEGRGYLATLLALPEAATVAEPRAGSLLGAGQLALGQGDYAAARTYLEESIELFRFLGDERGTAEALLCAGFVARVQEEYDTAQALLDEGLALSRSIGHPFITAASLHHLGMMAADARGDNAAARTLLEESLALYRALGLPRFIALVLFSLGDVVRDEGDYTSARGLLREGLTTMIEVGEKLALPRALESFAYLAVIEGAAERTARLAGAAARLREASGTRLWPVTERCRERWLTAARAALGEELFQKTWAEGQSMTSEQAIDYALATSTLARRASSGEESATHGQPRVT